MGMKFKSEVKFMGVEYGQNRDGKPFWRVGLMQGLDSRIFYIDQEDYDRLYNVPVGMDVEIAVEISSRDGRTYFNLCDFHVIQSSVKKAV